MECTDQRVNVSGAFFLSIEFMETGYFVYRLHKASFDSLPNFTPFLRDTQEVGRDVVVGKSGWEQQLNQNKQRLVTEWIQSADFKAKYNELSNAQYVDTLNANTGNSLTMAERDTLVAGLNAATVTRRSSTHGRRKRRVPPQGVQLCVRPHAILRVSPRRNADLPGYQFWLNKLNQFGGDFRGAEMVKAFITSAEYRSRFGPN